MNANMGGGGENGYVNVTLTSLPIDGGGGGGGEGAVPVTTLPLSPLPPTAVPATVLPASPLPPTSMSSASPVPLAQPRAEDETGFFIVLVSVVVITLLVCVGLYCAYRSRQSELTRDLLTECYLIDEQALAASGATHPYLPPQPHELQQTPSTPGNDAQVQAQHPLLAE